MRPPSTLLQLNAILVLFCAATMLFTNVADGQQSQPEDQPPPQQDKDTLGLGEFPIPAKKGEINLPSEIVLVNDKDKFDASKNNYEGAKVKPCNVKFDKDGNIEVFYDKLASTKGCTVDLLVNKMEQIEFVAKVEDKEKPKCLTSEVKDNLLPFIFNEANNGLAELTEGPIAGDEKDCPGSKKEKCDGHESNCIKRTMFEIGWELENGLIEGHLHQVGEPIDASFVSGKSDEAKLDVKMAVGDVSNKPLVKITSEAKSVDFPGTKPDEQPACNDPTKATPPPAIWKVNSENKEFNGKYFVTFHFFPQKAARIGGTNQAPTGGPNCKGPKQPSFVFSVGYAAGLLMSTPTTAKPTTPGTSTAPGSKTSIEPTTSGTSNGNSSTSTMNTTESAPTPASTEPPPTESTGLGTLAIVGIVAGAIALVVVVAVLVYCLCFRGKEEADENEEEDEPAAAAEDEDVEKAEGELPAASV